MFNLEKHTKHEELREYLHRIQCIEQPTKKVAPVDENNIQRDPYGLPQDDDAEYNSYDDGFGDGSSIRIKGEHVSHLLKMAPEQLPCPQELMAPTELPLQRESIGLMDLSWRSSATGVIAHHSVVFTLIAGIAVRFFW